MILEPDSITTEISFCVNGRNAHCLKYVHFCIFEITHMNTVYHISNRRYYFIRPNINIDFEVLSLLSINIKFFTCLLFMYHVKFDGGLL